jgi:hypothetical protein
MDAFLPSPFLRDLSYPTGRCAYRPSVTSVLAKLRRINQTGKSPWQGISKRELLDFGGQHIRTNAERCILITSTPIVIF